MRAHVRLCSVSIPSFCFLTWLTHQHRCEHTCALTLLSIHPHTLSRLQKFLSMIDARKQELMSEVFDLLLSLGCVVWCVVCCLCTAALPFECLSFDESESRVILSLLSTTLCYTRGPYALTNCHILHIHTHRDFEAFKEVMLSYKQEVVGGGLGFEVQVSVCICVCAGMGIGESMSCIQLVNGAETR